VLALSQHPSLPLPSLAAAGAFAAISFVIAISPGASWIYVITSRLRGGVRAGWLAIAGNATGILLHTLAVAAGLAAILEVSRPAFLAFRVLGAGYLIYLGVRTLLRDPIRLDPKLTENGSPVQKEHKPDLVYRDGVLMAVLNPKISLLILALMPQFVDPNLGAVPVQVFALGLLHVTIASTVLTLVAVASGALTGWLTRSPGARLAFRGLNGTLLMLFGIGLLLARR
jgi:threonine/homoserine/homoserine lactone efflux protein